MAKSHAKRGFSGYKRPGLVLFILFGFCGYLFFGRPLGFLDSTRSNEPVLYEIPKNATVSFLARDLNAKGLIAFPRVFSIFIRLTGQEKRIRAGYYYLPPRNSVVEMAFKLTSGKMATHTVTLPEGKASWEIYQILRHDFPLDSVTFDSLVRDSGFAHSMGVEAPGIEGYLYPDTYILPWRITERDILRSLVNRFQQVASDLPQNSEVIKRHGIHGWVTLASIVEKEAAVNSEQRLIAGVFYNRLRLGWSLGADPTTRFALRKLTGPLSAADLNIDSRYNTRRYSGLPPGPVCNPGREALIAALQPRKTDMMFFVAKDDGSREHFFSASNEEHNIFKLQAAANRARREEESDSLAMNPPASQDKILMNTQTSAAIIRSETTHTRISAAR